jgi:pyoverdine/dityrosine biosynthesis protein Dit1/AcrR family transcriptional regulator
VDAQQTRSRQRILESAVSLLSEYGLSGELVEAAAATARVPVTSAKLFFPTDEELILAFYLRINSDLQLRAAALPEGSVSHRFRTLVQAKLDLAAPYRDAFTGLFAKMLDPRTNIGVLSHQTELVRLRARAAFANVVHGAKNAPSAAGELTHGLYSAHLALLLIWSQDTSPNAASTHAALEIICKLTDLICRFRWTPLSANLLQSVGAIAGPLVDPPADPQHTQRAREILRLVFRHRRLLPHSDEKCVAAATATSSGDVCEHCLAPHLALVRRFVSTNLPVHFVLPAFPAKSPNPEKVLGTTPDLAEELSLEFLDNFCSEIRKIHKPGARITICSDGLVFSDLVGVADEDVLTYGQQINQIILQQNLSSLDAFHMQDLYDEADSIPQMRESLCRHYAESDQVIHERLHSNKNQQALFNGIQRFLFEDRVVIDKGKSRTRIREECKQRTYEVIQRSDAWGRLVADCFPASLRLSIHPQPPHSEKIGILLGKSPDVWLTPWHAVALKQKGEFRLIKRREAEEAGAAVVLEGGRPHFMEIAR